MFDYLNYEQGTQLAINTKLEMDQVKG